jgi:hypothetical protein
MTAIHLRNAADHEAGHAIVAWRLGLTILRLRIGTGGHPGKGGADIERKADLSLIDQIAICYGGIATQDMLDLEAHPESGMMDQYMVSSCSERIGRTGKTAWRYRMPAMKEPARSWNRIATHSTLLRQRSCRHSPLISPRSEPAGPIDKGLAI